MNENPSTPGAAPGALLKAARQAQGISIADAAARLCLNIEFIEDIERDDYTHMTARTYARGYVLSYAHILGIPATQILPALANVQMHFEPLKKTVSVDNERASPIYQTSEVAQQRSSLFLWGSILVLIIALGLILMWWKGPSTPPEAKTAQSADVIEPPASTNSIPSAMPPPAQPNDSAQKQANETQSLPPAAASKTEQDVLQPSELDHQAASAPDLPPPEQTENH